MGRDAVAEVLERAAGQHGVFRWAQARASQLSRRQLYYREGAGLWRCVAPGVYQVAGAPDSWRSRLSAALLWAAPNEVQGRRTGYALSHRSAAALHGFRRFPEGSVELTVSWSFRAPPGIVVRRVSALPESHVTVLDGLRVTTVPRTLVDLAATERPKDVRASVEQALSSRWIDLDGLERAIHRARGQRGVRFLRELLQEYRGGSGPAESELEALVFELLERAGVPRPLRQQTVRRGRRRRRLDFLIPGTRVVIEADGYAHHCGVEAFEEDRRRTNQLIARGYRVLHWTWAALHQEPERLLAELALTLRG